MSSLSQILQNCAQPATRAAAEQQLKEAQASNFPLYLLELSKELVSETSSPPPRSMAGLLIKLELSGQSDAFQQQKAERWLNQVDASTRKQVKDNCLQSLASPQGDASRAAAQAVAAIAFIELPLGQWPDLIPQLNASAANANVANELKVSTLQAIGYICEGIPPDCIPEEQVDNLLTSIVNAMNDNVPEKLYDAAIGAMLNTLEFAAHNMKKDAERNMLLNVIMSATKSKYVNVRVKAYECTVKLASHYYEYLSQYMKQLSESSFLTIRQDAEPVAMQAIEFWTTLCEEEIFLMEEAQEFKDTDRAPERTSANYIQTIGEPLTKLILEECLIKQEEEQDDETRNVATSAAMCLGFLSQCLGNGILPFILPFIEKNINDADWRKREASILAFGAMLEGPDPVQLQAPLHAAFELVLSKMLVRYEPNTMVRDTAAWAISVVCGFHTSLLDPSKHFEPLVKSLLVGLDDEARVARNVAYAIHNLARAFEPVADNPTNQLSGLFQHFITKLLAVTQREDRTEWELADNAYEAINNLVENAARDMHGLIKKLLEEVVRRLMLTLKSQPTTSEEKEEREQLQMFLCGNLLVIVQKLREEIIEGTGSNPDGSMPIPDRIIELMIEILKIPNAPAHSDAFMVIGAVANAVDSKFSRYLEYLMDLVLQGLNNHAEYQVCQNAVGVVGDICRTVEGAIDPYCDKIVAILHNNLKDEHLNRDVKPPTLAVFGDIALAIGPNFERFLQDCMSTIFAAAQTDVDREDEDLVEYLNTLRESILEACTGIIQGLNGDSERNIPSKGRLLEAYAEPLLQFVAHIATEVKNNGDVSPLVVKGAIGVIGDLVFVLGQPVKDKIIGAKHVVEPLFLASEQRGDKATMEIAQWAKRICGL